MKKKRFFIKIIQNHTFFMLGKFFKFNIFVINKIGHLKNINFIIKKNVK